MLATKVVEGDIFRFDTEIITHFHDAVVHHWWAAEVKFDIFRSRMILEIIVDHDLVNESGVACPIIFRQRFLER